VEHHTFLDQAWGTTLRPCVMPVTWDMQPPHQTPIVLPPPSVLSGHAASLTPY
jgi:hypothetical protein